MKYILIMAILLPAIGCGPSYVYEEKKEIPNGHWTWSDSLKFSFEIKDTAAVYNLYLLMDAREDYPNENIYLKLFTGFPDGHRLEYLKSFNIFDTKGMPVGERSGDVWKQRTVLQENAFFNQPGTYDITVKQYLRRDSIEGIRAVGIAVKKSK